MPVLKPQDPVVLLKLIAAHEPTISFNRLALELGMSPSEVHQAIKRAEKAGLVRTVPRPDGSHSKEVNRSALREFLVHGLKYVFPAIRGGETRGMPTAADAPILQIKGLSAASTLPAVWPDPLGTVRGLEFTPLYRSVPEAAKRDEKLYALLALVDAIRGGRARERRLAEKELERALAEERSGRR